MNQKTKTSLRDLENHDAFIGRHVGPDEADIAAGRISIMTPVGAGLIGLREGQSILWPHRGGETRVLRILKVGRLPALA